MIQVERDMCQTIFDEAERTQVIKNLTVNLGFS